MPKIIGHVDPDQFLLDDELKRCEVLFLGGCRGVGLYKRGGDADPHVCFLVLSEDDGHWFVSEHGASSYWLPDLVSQLHLADKWMAENCIAGRWGYTFKGDHHDGQRADPIT